MRLSDIKGERVFDVIADIIDPIVSIAEDDDAADLFRPQELPEGLTAWQFFLRRVKRSLPSLTRTHKDDLVRIMAAINGVTPDEYVDGLTFAKLIADVVELLTDEEFVSFFG